MSKHILVLGTGGTIAGTALLQAGDANYDAAQLSVAELMRGVGGLNEALQGLTLVSKQVAQVDSKDMSVAVWCDLAQAVAAGLQDDAVHAVVITHGTDTLEESVTWLHAVLPMALLARKPVVVTCSMRPASSAQADGPGNLRDSVDVAVRGAALGLSGVLVVCAGDVHHPLAVCKVHSHRLNAFDSGDWPLLARYEVDGAERALRINSKVNLMTNWPRVTGFIGLGATESGVIDWLGHLRFNGLPRVEIVHSHAGAGGEVVRDLMSTSGPVVRGLIVAATGNGTVHADLEAALIAAQSQGAVVWRSTRCVLGAVTARRDDVLPLTELTPPKARVAMQLALMSQRGEQLV